MQHENLGAPVMFDYVLSADEQEELTEVPGGFLSLMLTAYEQRGVLIVAGKPQMDEVPERSKQHVFEIHESQLSELLAPSSTKVLSIVHDALVGILASGLMTGYHLLKTWVDAKNGRKLKIKVGDIEVEATQMKEEDVLRIFELLEEKADRELIRKMLLEGVKAAGRPEAH